MVGGAANGVFGAVEFTGPWYGLTGAACGRCIGMGGGAAADVLDVVGLMARRASSSAARVELRKPAGTEGRGVSGTESRRVEPSPDVREPLELLRWREGLGLVVDDVCDI